MDHHFDVLVIGSGAAGLALALNMPKTLNVAVLSKGELHSGSTWYAQGGIAAVLDTEDTIDAHVNDTLVAGAGLCHPSTVNFTVANSKAAIEWLINTGVQFTRDNGQEFHLTREGGHSHRRIIHSADATGKAVHSTLQEAAEAAKHIKVFKHHVAIDLIRQAMPGEHHYRCTGAYVYKRDDDSVHSFSAKAVVLATGGASKVYLYTSNPDGASGDGIAMAWRAGCRIANMEFNQFHPTCLHHPSAKSYLVTEALRGEGATLLLPDGKRFMHKFHDKGELAPRDVVARAIDHEMKRLGADCLYLDISHKPRAFIEEHFPSVMKNCAKFGGCHGGGRGWYH